MGRSCSADLVAPQLPWAGTSLTVSGLQTVRKPQGQVAFGLELCRFLSRINDGFGKLLSLFQLKNQVS